MANPLGKMDKTEGSFRILMLGDVVGRPGREAIAKIAPFLREQWSLEMLVVNGENASGGAGIVPSTAKELFAAGVDFITLGDHGLQRKDIFPYLDQNATRIVRPSNYPAAAPGAGATVWEHANGTRVGVVNLLGRVFMGGLWDCPFKEIDAILEKEIKEADIRLVDFHAEATSEKRAMGMYLDGRVSLLVGTHTHVQTADASILENGTGYITDLGMTGGVDTVIGMDTAVALKRFTTGMHAAYKLGKSSQVLACGVLVDIDPTTSKALAIQAVRIDPALIPS